MNVETPLYQPIPQFIPGFVGRSLEMERITQMFARSRLVTLTGESGIGKTRLALEASARLGRPESSIYFVDLAALTGGEYLPQALLQALGVRETLNSTVTETLIESLKLRSLLIILDHCDELPRETARLTGQLLKACPDINFLVTSREPLNLPGEGVIRVAPLEFPDAIETFQHKLRSAAVHLFAERARHAAPSFILTDTNARPIAQLCRHLEGLPLAIELAAARTHLLTVNQIAFQLSEVTHSPASAWRLPADHRPQLDSVIQWTYDLLSEADQVLLRRLSIFRGSWLAAAAEEVCAPGLPGQSPTGPDFSMLLNRLVRYGLVQETCQRPPRYRLPQRVQRFARAQLAAASEVEATQERYEEFYLKLAGEAGSRLLSPDQAGWRQRIQAELPDFQAAFEGSLAGGRSEIALRMASALQNLWVRHGHYSQGLAWYRQALAAAGPGVQAAQAQALTGLAELELIAGLMSPARDALAESIRLSLENSLDATLAQARTLLARVDGEDGQLAKAQMLASQGMAGFHALANKPGTLLALNVNGDICRAQEDYSQADRFYQEGLAMAIVMDDLWHTGSFLKALGHVSRHQGDLPLAQFRWREALIISQKTDDPLGSAAALAGLASLALERGDTDRSATLFGASQQILESLGARLDFADRLDAGRDQEQVIQKLGSVEFQASLEAGKAMSEEQAAAFALGGTDVRVPPESRNSLLKYEGLSPREQQVVRLIAAGKSDTEIAQDLFVEPRTVQGHIEHVLVKLGLESRHEIAWWAVENGLAEQPHPA